MQHDPNSEEYRRAKKRVKKLRGFYEHLFIYLIVNFGLFMINILSSPGRLWFYWPMLGWGIGILSHGLSAFGRNTLLSYEWEEKKIKEILDKKNDNIPK